MRKSPTPPTDWHLLPKLLRNTDEQSVLGLHAVWRAIEDFEIKKEDCEGWGVLASACFPGRISATVALHRFRRRGMTSVSPHVIPQTALHSPSGVISIGLGLTGPNYGISGGPTAVSEGLISALSATCCDSAAGTWLVISQWSPEPDPDADGAVRNATTCRAVTMALTARPAASAPLRLRLAAGSAASVAEQQVSVEDLANFLQQSNRATRGWSLELDWGGRIELLDQRHENQEGHRRAA